MFRFQSAPGVELFDIVGPGDSASIVVPTSSRRLKANVLLRLASKAKIKDVSLTAVLTGEATLNDETQCFLEHEVGIVEGEDWMATEENEGLFGFPLSFVVKTSRLPPSMESEQGSIQYHLQCILSCQESFKLFRSVYETEFIPVLVKESKRTVPFTPPQLLSISHPPSAFFNTPSPSTESIMPSQTYISPVAAEIGGAGMSEEQRQKLVELMKLQKEQAAMTMALKDIHGLASGRGMNEAEGSLLSATKSENESDYLYVSPEERDAFMELNSLFTSTPVSLWSVDMVGAWIKQFGVSPASVTAFSAQEIDGTALLTLTGNDLAELKVATLGARKRILVGISKLISTA
ncbi:hypothetical protein HDU79_005045 [Rhizoclosmatium sp. JEL0117]|nr:hypothetical protein HDU79_005045 [Rhizoclosmatium sp. JEL0117]